MLKATLATASLLISTSHSFAEDSSSKALAVLKKAAETIQNAKSIEVRALATADEIQTENDFKVQKIFMLDVKMERPDKLYAARMGDENQVAYFDGKTFTIVDPMNKRFGQEALVGSVDDLVKKLDERNIQAPLMDLLRGDLFDAAKKAIKKAQYFGSSKVTARNCEHVGFRTEVADWQLWVAENGTICKSLITSRNLAQGPQYEVTFGAWKLNGEIDDSKFAAQIPAGGSQVDLASGSFRSK